MSEVAARVVGLGKQYRIGGHPERPTTLRDSVHTFFRAPRARLARAFRPATEAERFWALKDVSFDLEVGTVLGVVGRNGAGKSTLLKILSRITEPTAGYADVFGRLASLLEVGTGFHPELTGRDNVYLNGAILGMRRTEVAAKFSDIVEFAGVERFIDTPVKRYSSGMHMRLAFAVAAHLEPDVLVVDEVLAVGDVEFQRRSIGKMKEVTSAGRTVVFVSHNLPAVKALCDRAILLEQGCVRLDGDVDSVLAAYLGSALKADAAGVIPPDVDRLGTAEARFVGVKLVDRTGGHLDRVHLGEPFTIVLTVDADQFVEDGVFEIGISTPDGTRIATSFSTDGESPFVELPKGASEISLDLDLTLLPGHYSLDLGLHHGSGLGSAVDYLERVLDFEALAWSEASDDRYRSATVRGFVRPRGDWHPPVPVDSQRSRARVG